MSDNVTCKMCRRPMRKRFDGPCVVVMELEPGIYKLCGLARNAQADPVDPHTWDGGYDHVRDDRDIRICACHHEYHQSECAACAQDHLTWLNAGHGYLPGSIELDHRARL